MGLFNRLQGELEAQEKASGLSMADVLSLPDSLRKLCNWMLKQKRDVTLEEVVTYTKQSEPETRQMLADLVEKGFVRELSFKTGPVYRVRLARKAGKDIPLNLWDSLGEKTE